MSSPSHRPGRLGVGVVSAGKVGAVLGAALRAAGHAVVGVHASSGPSRERAAALLPDVPVLDVQTVVERSELVLLAVPDDLELMALFRLGYLPEDQSRPTIDWSSRHRKRLDQFVYRESCAAPEREDPRP